ncbi:sensor domain-containing protein [Massilia cavernae]|nr:EAL domain-containing protein [Massilia cavernae]
MEQTDSEPEQDPPNDPAAEAARPANPAAPPAGPAPPVPDAVCAIAYVNASDVVFHLAVEGEDTYRFANVNPAFYRATALSPGQVLGRLVQEVIPEPSCTLVLQHYREAIASRQTRRWEECTDYPAGQKAGLVSVTPVFDGHGRCTDLVGTVNDITDVMNRERQLMQAHRELEKSFGELSRLSDELTRNDERLNFALEGTGEGVWDWRPSVGRMFYSPQWKRIIGLAEEINSDDPELWLSRVHPDDVQEVLRKVALCMDPARNVCTHEYRLRREPDDWIWVRMSGTVVERNEASVPERIVGTIVDITEQVRLRQKLEASHELLAQLAQHVPGVFFELQLGPDGKTTCPFISAVANELFELSPAAIQADTERLAERIQPQDRMRARRAFLKSAASLEPWHMELRVGLPDKGLRWIEVSATPTRRPDKSTVWHGFAHDITRRKNAELTITQFNETLERRAHYDALTGLPNRALFRDRLEHGMRQAEAASGTLALLFIDLDRFKEVNDMLGHDAGDALLIEAAQRIERCLGPGDTVARLGGDEFTVIIVEAGELEHVEQTAQRILDTLAMPFEIGVEPMYVSGSIGIARYPIDAKGPEDLMRIADHAMYRSKAAGRNQLTFFESDMQVAAMQRLKLISDLRGAQADGQLELYFQPIVELDTGRVVKAEALLRWRRAGEGLVMPAEFVKIAEECGMIHDIGNWVFTTAALWSKRWSELTGSTFQISINKSPVQFERHHRTMDWIDHLRKLGVPPSSISVEITEGVLLNLSENVFAKLYELREGGVEVAIDDFGTGYSSMSYLKRLDIDYLKIDQSFVAEMLHDPTTSTITDTIIVMGHKLGLKVIAEGVETAAQRDWLAARQCDYAQGFLFAAPMPPEEFERMLLG